MAMVAKAKTFVDDSELVPKGRYLAICIGVSDIGTQTFKDGKSERQIIAMWELHKRNGPAMDSKARVHTTMRFYSLKFGIGRDGNKAKLRNDVEIMLGKEFTEAEAKDGYDVEQLVGKACCEVQIDHKPRAGDDKKIDAYIKSMMTLDAEDPIPEVVSNTWYYEVDPSSPIPSEIPGNVKYFIEKSREWVAVHGVPKSDKDKAKPKSDGYKPDPNFSETGETVLLDADGNEIPF